MKNVKDTLGFKVTDDILVKLKKDYYEALEDPDFKLLVNQLNLKEDELIKFTSTLKDASEEFANCSKCKGLAACKNKLQGYAYLPNVLEDNLTFEYKACKFKQAELEKNKYLNNVHLFEAPAYVKTARMKDIYKDDKKRFDTIKWLISFIKTYEKNPKQKGLYLNGNFGCGKTYLIAAMFNELATKNVKSTIIFWPEFLRDLKTSFDTNFKQKFEQVKKAPLLLIDDIGAENTTAWSRDEIFCPLIQYRMQENLPTFFTSNLSLKELEGHFSLTKDSVDHVKARRIISRIEQLTNQIEMISENLRK